jgi:protease secretion system outer membrane protein
MRKLKTAASLTLGFTLAAALGQAQAIDLLTDYQRATAFDPTFQTALAERMANQASATQSYTAYAPVGSLNNQRIQTDSTNRTTLTISQPLLNYEALSTFRQAEPRKGYAEATFVMKQQELATRLLKAANAVILANENLKLNNAKIKALDQQYMAAKRKLELGQGTITDQRDIEVKVAQAKSAQIGFKNQLDTAAKQYAAITGERPNVAEFVLPEKHGKVALKQPQDYADLALQNSPAILAAKFSERVAELDVEKATGSMLPTLSATYTDSKSANVANRYTGVTINVPLGASAYFAREGVSANYLKAKETRRDTEEKARVEVEKLRSQVDTAFESLDIQLDAIKAAELSVEANAKSYEGGVRSAVDVLNATQTVFQVKSEYVTAVTTQTENLLALMNLASTNPMESLETAYKFLFAR